MLNAAPTAPDDYGEWADQLLQRHLQCHPGRVRRPITAGRMAPLHKQFRYPRPEAIRQHARTILYGSINAGHRGRFSRTGSNDDFRHRFTQFVSGATVTLTSSASNGYLWSNGATTRSIVVSAAGTI